MDEKAAPTNWSEYDHLEMAAMEDPAPMFAELRGKCPVGHSEKHGGFHVITGYEDCAAASRDPRISSSTDRGPGPGFPYGKSRLLPSCMIADDGQRHRDFRAPLQETFSAKSVAGMGPRIREICSDLIDQFIERGTADLAVEYAHQVPSILTIELLDLPRDRGAEFADWAHRAVASSDPAAMKAMADYTDELYDVRTRNPGNDIPSQLLKLQIEGQPISRIDWRGAVNLLVLAGLDTTANAGALALHLLGTDPALRRHLLEDNARIPKAVNEMLRYLSPVPQHSRGVTEDMTLGGHAFHKGDVVQLNWFAANRDPGQFPDPDRFDPERTPNRHLAFGFGVHRCLGSHLALMELQIMIEEVLARLPDYEIEPGGVARYKSLNRGMKHLQVRFQPGLRHRAGTVRL